MTVHHTLADVLGAELPISPGNPFKVQTEAVRQGRNILDDIGLLASGFLPEGHVLAVADHHTFPANGPQLETSLKGAGYQVSWLLLEDGSDGKVEADAETVTLVQEAISSLVPKCVGVIGLGAGTVNDLAKLSSFNLGLPYGIVATAASMNGYTSAIAAILAGGVKRTIPCHAPKFVLADMDVVASAPIAMARAGLGDLMSKPVSSGDWHLSHLVMGEPFYELPVRLVESAFARTRAVARQIGEGDPDALGHLMEALMLSGISMASAGSSSPASGGEHLLSHLFDMTAPYRGRHVGLHGAQVGVTTQVTATLYAHLRSWRPDPGQIASRVAKLAPFEIYGQRLESLPAEIQGPVAVESKKKYPTQAGLRDRLEELADSWTQIWDSLSRYLQPPAVLRQTLAEAGAPLTAQALGISDDEMREAYRLARDIRSRYTVLDLAWELGALEPLEETVLKESGVIGH